MTTRSLGIPMTLAFASALLFTSACASGSTSTTPGGDDPTLVIYGSGAASASLVMPDSGSEGLFFGPAASLTIKLYALYISTSGDCSSPVLAQDLGGGVDKDFMLNPVLFEATPAAGTYQCVMLKMSDVLRMKPGANIGSCVTGHEYAGDIYRDGESDWKDAFLNPITGTGTDDVPADDHVTVFITRDPEAAMARGISPNQIVSLQSNLIVPGQTTFTMDASNAVGSDGVQCGIMPPVMSFH